MKYLLMKAKGVRYRALVTNYQLEEAIFVVYILYIISLGCGFNEGGVA